MGEFVLTHVADVAVVLDSLIQMTERSAAKASFRFSKSIYSDISKGLVRFSNLQAMLPENGKRQAIIRFYESVKSIGRLQNDPHFWLQYAVARITLDNLKEARQYFKTAYALCRKRPGYDTSFIDNHFARFLLVDAIANNNPSQAMDAFRQAATIITRQARKTTNRHYPFRVGGMFAEFFDHFSPKLSDEEKKWILDRARDVLLEIPKLPPRIQDHYSVRDCSQKLSAMLRKCEADGF
ncbi:hypothetical protein DTL42_01280 [Bremerella cremea]|uniref:Uncharacterized protein n=1 Tax=Bremerella cremea TaxID=1031537 RepID=A0A368KZ48_9BACT|nr:hypothetical protein [Bremerella cremea]RCS55765.1 hypothetical protein DTL42_01280 [Bremerella cremea]